jgi:hypothetical protein
MYHKPCVSTSRKVRPVDKQIGHTYRDGRCDIWNGLRVQIQRQPANNVAPYVLTLHLFTARLRGPSRAILPMCLLIPVRIAAGRRAEADASEKLLQPRVTHQRS